MQTIYIKDDFHNKVDVRKQKGANESRGDCNKAYWIQWRQRQKFTKAKLSEKIRSIRKATKNYRTELDEPKNDFNMVGCAFGKPGIGNCDDRKRMVADLIFEKS